MAFVRFSANDRNGDGIHFVVHTIYDERGMRMVSVRRNVDQSVFTTRRTRGAIEHPPRRGPPVGRWFLLRCEALEKASPAAWIGRDEVKKIFFNTSYPRFVGSGRVPQGSASQVA